MIDNIVSSRVDLFKYAKKQFYEIILSIIDYVESVYYY